MIKFEAKEGKTDLVHLMETLPLHQRIRMTIYVYEERYSRLYFIRNKSLQFITWMCPLLKPKFYEGHEYISIEGDFFHDIYFLVAGNVAFVLPHMHNHRYINIHPQNHFGVIDIIGSSQ